MTVDLNSLIKPLAQQLWK